MRARPCLSSPSQRLRAPRAALCAVLIVQVAALPGCISYRPAPVEEVPFMRHAKSAVKDDVEVTVAALGRDDAQQLFPVKLYRRGIQPLWVEIQNEGERPYIFFQQTIDPSYWAPIEAAYTSHYSATKRFLGYGIAGIFLWPLLAVAPIQFVTARIANNRMDKHFVEHGIGNHLIEPGDSRKGFVFTHIDEGTKPVTLTLQGAEGTQDYEFLLDVPGLARDYERVDFEGLYAGQEIPELSEEELHKALRSLPCCVTSKDGKRNGDPMNLVVIGKGESLREGFTRAGWDETEIVTAGSGLRTARSFIFSSEYRYSPVSSLHVYGRPQDVALQKARDTIHERNHLRLWLAPFTFEKKPVWVGQVSRDIGVKFHWRTITTHAIDGDVDDARENVIGDLISSGRLSRFTYVPGVGSTEGLEKLPQNLTGDEYHTDGYRGVAILEPGPSTARYVDLIPIDR